MLNKDSEHKSDERKNIENKVDKRKANECKASERKTGEHIINNCVFSMATEKVDPNQIAKTTTILETCYRLSHSFEKAKREECYYYAFYQNNFRRQIRGYIVVDRNDQSIYGVFLGTQSWRDLRFDIKFTKITSPFDRNYSTFIRTQRLAQNNSNNFTETDNDVTGHIRDNLRLNQCEDGQRSSLDGKIHSGFYQIYQEAQIPFYSLLSRLREKYPDYRLILVGHSLGGALAIFSSINLIFSGHNPTILGFCLPKLGDAKFNQNLLQLYRRKGIAFYQTRNFWDPVTRLPPSIFGYESLYKYKNNGQEHRRVSRNPHNIANFREE